MSKKRERRGKKGKNVCVSRKRKKTVAGEWREYGKAGCENPGTREEEAARILEEGPKFCERKKSSEKQSTDPRKIAREEDGLWKKKTSAGKTLRSGGKEWGRRTGSRAFGEKTSRINRELRTGNGGIRKRKKDRRCRNFQKGKGSTGVLKKGTANGRIKNPSGRGERRKGPMRRKGVAFPEGGRNARGKG